MSIMNDLFSNEEVKKFIEYMLEDIQNNIGNQPLYPGSVSDEVIDCRKKLCDSCFEFNYFYSESIKQRIINLHNAKCILLENWRKRIPDVMDIVLEFFPEKSIRNSSLTIIQEYLY
jgi:hypothetical protein